jgi:rare lipoprotein A (peptidoglycan hydrolase)
MCTGASHAWTGTLTMLAAVTAAPEPSTSRQVHTVELPTTDIRVMRPPTAPPMFSCALILALGWGAASAEQSTTGIASFYSAVPATPDNLTAAHRHLPFGTRVRVIRVDTGEQVVVRINDRGPFIKGRIIDLSRSAAQHLRMIDAGHTRVRLEVVVDAVAQETAIALPNCEVCELVRVEAHD